MILLLDSHVFLWWESEPARLRDESLAAIQESDNTILVSVVTLWELQIKSDLGKLSLRLPLAEIVETQLQHGIDLLPIEREHIYALQHLPHHHRDPFDRLLIAQARSESLTLVTADSVFDRYEVSVMPA